MNCSKKSQIFVFQGKVEDFELATENESSGSGESDDVSSEHDLKYEPKESDCPVNVKLETCNRLLDAQLAFWQSQRSNLKGIIM